MSQFPSSQSVSFHSYHDCASISQAPIYARSFVDKVLFLPSPCRIGRFALTAFRHGRIIEFRDALSGKAIAVFCFWRRHAHIDHSFDCHCIGEIVNP
jgi:hypothetical protein